MDEERTSLLGYCMFVYFAAEEIPEGTGPRTRPLED